jgi:hypothetical protein
MAVAAGYYHSLALLTDGTVIGWGDNRYGQTNSPAGLTNVVAIASGAYHNLALKADGTVVAWGAGTTSTGTSPNYGQAIVPVGLSNVMAIAAGAYHSLAVRSDGTLVAWGAGTTSTGSNPNFGQALIPVGLSNVMAVAADGYHVLALEGDGSPHVTVQPLSRIAAPGAGVAFLAFAVGNQPLSYQWQCNGTNLTDNGQVAGSQSGTLTVANVLAGNTGSYQLIVTNACGSATSAPATLTVTSTAAPPVFLLSALRQSNGVLSFTWTAAPGQSYQVQYKTNLTDTNWLNSGAPIMATSGTASAADTATSARRFYRIILVR